MNLDRILIEKIENRILVGILGFVGVMVIVGWIAINEPARMAAFEDQFQGRSIERGAWLFNQNCSSCHGTDGRGLQGVAPGLNSPHLFGYNFLASIDREVDQLNRELNTEITDERRTEIDARIVELQNERTSLLTQMQPAIDNGYDPDAAERMGQVEWEGTVRSYVYTTLVHGRPGSTAYWPQGMAAWGQTSGGPMRDDQLQDLTNYVMNWDKGNAWTIDDLNAVGQFAKLPVDAASVQVADAGAVADDSPVVGTDVDAILAALPEYTGDPNAGQNVYVSVYACAGCHGNAVVAPPTENQWIWAVEGAEGRPHAGEPERYIVESIVAPGAYVVAGYPAGAMPANFGDQITMQEMANILAYVQSFD